ncbi:uncharacterized protein METZ01_LOCUS334284 [marine metagenome]|uniref:Uncharacterized protein n=1 Tax=marine metagenome TaxID=408172 RepID=A0A382Q8Z4_9ZZZZ
MFFLNNPVLELISVVRTVIDITA